MVFFKKKSFFFHKFVKTNAMSKHLKLISSEYIEKYSDNCKSDWFEVFNKLRIKQDFSTEDFEYYVTASSLFSSKIEGNTLDFNSFYRHRNKKEFIKKKEFIEIENLLSAYLFASKNKLNKTNFLKAHEILSKTLLPLKERGVLRKYQVGVRDSETGKPAYMAVEPEYVKDEISKLFSDITELLKRKLSYKETFYYTSMIHIWIAKIHPFGDGNGRIARLTEKWVLASHIGLSAWSIPSEKYYWEHRPEYYQNIALGYNYYSLFWNRCIQFY